MKKCICFLVLLCGVLGVAAQQPRKFSPEKFQADLEQFITKEACLTPQEATKFFPLYREMLAKQRAIYDKMRRDGSIKPTDEKTCKQIIQRHDVMEIDLKSLQQTYHNKFFLVLPPSKVFEVIKAEDRYHRRMFKAWGERHRNRKANPKGN
ncbi:MAG: hypothetical protein K5764_04120 [Prevotella sp.]|nr:hypothetical protein [Prevotella sp.]